ncbi:ABC transporter [Desulfofustis limnaeus]|uniref:ABC transporter n=1 Tax=Desulfofustis limnaeus TaxID=2740163 RepID=A0ABN6M072_9BACT|nr:ABC transporter [Desulfofustis limnaeus]
MKVARLLAVIGKEILVLSRDRAGLLVLFVMPAVLVIVITLVQDNVMRLTGQQPSQLLLLDLDRGPVGSEVLRQLDEAGLTVVVAGDEATAHSVRTQVVAGRFAVGLIIPTGTSRILAEQVRHVLQRSAADPGDGRQSPAIAVPLVFDPALTASLRQGLSWQIEAVLAAVGRQRMIGALESALAPLLSTQPDGGSGTGRPSPTELSQVFALPLLQPAADRDDAVPDYRPVQQNVPAWALFGMFFSAIPLGVGLLKERTAGIWLRLRTLPVSLSVLLGGKAVAYLLVCCCQFLLIVVIGVTVFPLVGLPVFSVAANPGAVVAVVLLSGLAACSFGILLGVWCRTQEQASTLGAVAVVIGAALGGIMVPVYAMPPLLQRLSVVSPLNWGLNGFHEVLVRDGPLSAAGGDMLRLLLFTGGVLVLAVWRMRLR